MSDGYNTSVSFTDADVKKCMPHIKGVMNVFALQEIEMLLCSYVREAGCEIMSQLLRDAGWDIDGNQYLLSIALGHNK